MTINSLIPTLARELRDISLPYQFADDDLFSALVDGVNELNTLHYQQFEISGTGASAAIIPEPNNSEKKLWILASAIILVSGEKIRASANAFVISNAGGRTDLTGIPEALGSAIRILYGRLNKIIEAESRGVTESQMESREKTRQAVE